MKIRISAADYRPKCGRVALGPASNPRADRANLPHPSSRPSSPRAASQIPIHSDPVRLLPTNARTQSYRAMAALRLCCDKYQTVEPMRPRAQAREVTGIRYRRRRGSSESAPCDQSETKRAASRGVAGVREDLWRRPETADATPSPYKV